MASLEPTFLHDNRLAGDGSDWFFIFYYLSAAQNLVRVSFSSFDKAATDGRFSLTLYQVSFRSRRTLYRQTRLYENTPSTFAFGLDKAGIVGCLSLSQAWCGFRFLQVELLPPLKALDLHGAHATRKRADCKQVVELCGVG